MSEIKVSIIVPVYNAEQYLKQCIESLINQTYRNLEIVIINDGSTDNSPNLCSEFARKDSRIIYIDQANRGVSAARNVGIEHATGEWLAFVDSDDWADPDMIRNLLSFANQCDVVIGDYYIVNKGRARLQSFFGEAVFEEKDNDFVNLIGNALGCLCYGAHRQCNIGVPWAKIYRRDFLNKRGIRFPEDIRHMEDTLMNIDVFLGTKRISFCHAGVYYYRVLNSSASRRYDVSYAKTAEMVLSGAKSRLDDNPRPEVQMLVRYKEAQTLLESLSFCYCHPMCTLAPRERIREIKRIGEMERNRKILSDYPRFLFRKRDILRFWLLSHRFYRTTYLLYEIKNKLHWRDNVE